MGGMPCRIRLVLFAGHGTSGTTGLLTVPLSRCVGFIVERMSHAQQAMASAQWKDPTLAMFALLAKVSAGSPAAIESIGTAGNTAQPGRLGS